MYREVAGEEAEEAGRETGEGQEPWGLMLMYKHIVSSDNCRDLRLPLAGKTVHWLDNLTSSLKYNTFYTVMHTVPNTASFIIRVSQYMDQPHRIDFGLRTLSANFMLARFSL